MGKNDRKTTRKNRKPKRVRIKYVKIEEGKDYTIAQLKMLRSGKLTDEVVTKLVDAFKNDLNNEEASDYAGIHPDTYNNWRNWSSEFRDKMDSAKRFLMAVAKNNIAKAVSKGDVDNSFKLLERRQKNTYSTRVENVNTEVDYDKLLEDLDDKYKPEELSKS